ncbi:hypothetical protein [Streptomyces cyaneofuscatus]
MDEIAYDAVDLLHRRLHAKFRATAYRAAEQRLRASWAQPLPRQPGHQQS